MLISIFRMAFKGRSCVDITNGGGEGVYPERHIITQLHNCITTIHTQVDDTILMQATVYKGYGCRNSSIPGDLNMNAAWYGLFEGSFFMLCHLMK